MTGVDLYPAGILSCQWDSGNACFDLLWYPGTRYGYPGMDFDLKVTKVLLGHDNTPFGSTPGAALATVKSDINPRGGLGSNSGQLSNFWKAIFPLHGYLFGFPIKKMAS
eukprot:1226497-Rhodomonas_salina.1